MVLILDDSDCTVSQEQCSEILRFARRKGMERGKSPTTCENGICTLHINTRNKDYQTVQDYIAKNNLPLAIVIFT